MKALTVMISRYVIAQIIFFFFSLPLLVFPRRIFFPILYPIFVKLYLFAPKIRVHNLTKKSFEKQPPVIYAGNHKCFADFCFIAKYLKKPFTIMIKKEMIDNIFFRFLAWRMNLIPIDRNKAVSQAKAMEKTKKIIVKDKYSLIMFPEGWLNCKEPVGKLKKGIAKLAEETGAKVIPIAIYGIMDNFYHEKKLYWKDVYIKAGEHISYKDFNDRMTFLNELKIRIEELYFEIENELKIKEKKAST